MNRTRTEPRRIDRERRQRIIEGARAVIVERGVEGLTSRRAAEAAGVPLSAPSYYFSSVEDLLEGALATAAEHDIRSLRARFAVGPDADGLAELLATYVTEGVRSDRAQLVAMAELYVAALRRPRLKEVARQWNQAWLDLLSPVVGDVAALTLTMLAGALAQRALLDDAEPDVDELRRLFEPAITGSRRA